MQTMAAPGHTLYLYTLNILNMYKTTAMTVGSILQGNGRREGLHQETEAPSGLACLRVNLRVRSEGVVHLAAVRDAPERLDQPVAQHAHLRAPAPAET